MTAIRPKLSVIIPALNAAARLGDCLTATAAWPGADVVVVDGGSTDDTVAVAALTGANIGRAPRGRGSQLKRGAELATGDWFLFLHADTVPAGGWVEEAAAFMADPANKDKAAVFRFALDDGTAAARRMERLVAWRSRVLALPYGDQGLLMHRQFYESLGGFADVPIMEDVDLIRRIGRSRLYLLTAQAVTSAERYRRGGYWRRPLRNLVCLFLYFCRVPPRWIARLYG